VELEVLHADTILKILAQPSCPQATRHGSQSGTFPTLGKGGISDWIVDTMPDHETYVEVFGGGAGVLYQKPRSKYEIYNDADKDLAQFFTVLRDRPDDLAEWLRSVPYSRAQYDQWVAEFYNGVRPDDPIERAGIFFAPLYAVSRHRVDTKWVQNTRKEVTRTYVRQRSKTNHTLARRFDQVTVESQDYHEILEKYDDSAVDVLFYADPPYVGGEDQYKGNSSIKSSSTVCTMWRMTGWFRVLRFPMNSLSTQL